MNTAREFREHMAGFIASNYKPAIEGLDIQVYSSLPLRVTIGYGSMIPSIMFRDRGGNDGFEIYIAKDGRSNGPDQNECVFVWGLEDNFKTLLKKCAGCLNLQEIVTALENFEPPKERS